MWIFILTFTLFVNGNYGDTFSYCKLNDRHFDKCVIGNIQSAMKMLKPGFPEYGMKSLDPLYMDTLIIGSGSGPVRLVQNYDNVTLSGLSDMVVKKAHWDNDKKKILILGQVPLLSQEGHYVATGAILALPVNGDGHASLKLVDTEILAEFQCEEVQKNGKTYLKIKSHLFNIVPKNMKLHFENLFNGNKLLGDNINKVINEEWDALYKDVKPEIEKSYGQKFRDYAQVFFDKVPYDQIFVKG